MSRNRAFFKVFVFLIITLLIGGCIPPHNPAPNPQARIEEYIHFDSEFSGFESTIIQNAANEWSYKTHGFVKWDKQDWPLYEPSSPLFPFTTNGNCGKHLLVMRMNSGDQTIMDIDSSAGYKIAGYAKSSPDVCGTEIIFLVMDRIHSLEQLRLVVLHEVGHIFGLKHTVGSIMDGKGYMSKCITHKDFKNFCDIWDCNPDEFEVC